MPNKVLEQYHDPKSLISDREEQFNALINFMENETT